MSNYTCISTGQQLNIPSLDKSSTICQLTPTGQLVLLESIKNATGRYPTGCVRSYKNESDKFDTRFAKLFKIKQIIIKQKVVN